MLSFAHTGTVVQQKRDSLPLNWEGVSAVDAIFKLRLEMVKLTKLEKSIVEAIKTARLGLPDWKAFAEQEKIAFDYIQQRVDWMRRMGLIK